MRLGKWTLSVSIFHRCWCEDHKRNHPTGVRFPFLFIKYPFGGWLVRVLWIEARRWEKVYGVEGVNTTPPPNFTCIDGSLPIPRREND